MSGNKKKVTCLICSREMTVSQVQHKNRYSGTCPHCGTHDYGTAKGRLVINAEISLCEADGHEWEWHGKRRTCQRCGDWEEYIKTDSPSLGYQLMLVDARE